MDLNIILHFLVFLSISSLIGLLNVFFIKGMKLVQEFLVNSSVNLVLLNLNIGYFEYVLS